MLFCFCFAAGSSSCNSKTDCVSCTMKSSWLSGSVCRWCPLDRRCHALGAALYNPCVKNQDITDPKLCYDKTIGHFNPDSAFINTLLSAVAYSSNPMTCMDMVLPESGFKLVDAIGRKCEQLSIFNYAECFAFTAVSDTLKLIVVSFKGTAGGFKQLFDEAVSFTIQPKQPFLIGANVQVYFKTVFEKFYSCVKPSVHDLVAKNPDYDVVVTGHSLGGALASLTASALIHQGVVSSSKVSLYTFGMPRVGDKDYAIEFDRLVDNSWRVVRYKDIVPHLPTCSPLGFGCEAIDGPSHHGLEVFYEQDMSVNSSYTVCESDEDIECSNGIISSCFPVSFGECIAYHSKYYNIPISTYCDRDESGKRSTVEDAEFMSEFTNDMCMRIPFDPSSRQSNGVTSPHIGRCVTVMLYTLVFGHM